MDILPAIDLLDGNVVRLHQGRYDAVSIYAHDGAAVARRYRAHVGAIHVVDLAGARDGAPTQLTQIKAIIEAFDGDVQIGGGIRTEESLETLLGLGAKRIVLGTAAVTNLELVRQLATAHPGVVVVAVDARDGFVTTAGWTKQSQVQATDLVRQLAGTPLAAVLYTDIERDGTRRGPNLDATARVAEVSSFPVIASGGVGSLRHIRDLSQIPNVASAVIGRALYDGTMSVEEAVAAAAGTEG